MASEVLFNFSESKWSENFVADSVSKITCLSIMITSTGYFPIAVSPVTKRASTPSKLH